MVARRWQLWTPLIGAFALLLGCLQTEGGTTTTVSNTDFGTGDGLEDDFDEGQDGGGLLGGCEQYLAACEQDPYCVCFLQCAVEYESTVGCLERCNLATTPYWAEQFIACIQDELGEIPGQDSGDGGEGRSE
jgi:hypothetical protein